MKKRIPHRIKADPSRQVPGSGYSQPPEVYADEYKVCRGCKREFLFSAGEQRVWYEEYGIPHLATAVRCKECSGKRERSAVVKELYDSACAALKHSPEDARINLSFAKVALLHHQTSSVGRLEDIVGAFNHTLRLDPNEVEAYYWLGLCHWDLGRVEKARVALSVFVERTKDKKRGELKKLRKNAEAWLDQVG